MIILYRIGAGIFILFPLMLNINEYVLILVTGSLISPCLGFVFPILAYNYYFKNSISIWRKIFNYFILIVGVLANIASFYELIIN